MFRRTKPHPDTPQAAPHSRAATPPLRFGWLISLAFWLVLLLAAALYASVALAPKLLACVEHRQKWWKNQERLVTLERRVHYLQDVAEALEKDPQFAAEVARIELQATQPGEERLPVDEELALEAVREDSDEFRQVHLLPPYAPLLVQLTENAALRRLVLLTAAALCLFAFVFLHESQYGRLKRAARFVHNTATGLKKGARWLKRRYRNNPWSGPWGVS